MAYNLALIIVSGLLADYLFSKIRLPGLVGMLMVGILAGPHMLNLISPEMSAVSQDFRKIALIVILLRAGFELKRDTLKQVGAAAVLMSVIPAVFEIAGIAWIAPKLLGFTFVEALILGSILAAVSPAVVVPLMIDFIDRKKGQKKGIPTLLLGASSLDDVFVIVLFSGFLGMYGNAETHIASQVYKIPVSIITGILSGLAAGYALYLLFSRIEWTPPKRTLIVLAAGIFLTGLESALEDIIPIASLLGVMSLGFIILEKFEDTAKVISLKLKRLWVFAELLLFVLVGTQVNIHVAFKAGLAGLAVILIGLVFRSVGTYISLLRAGLSFQEKIFCIVAYLPKATVQAAIGALPLAAGVASGEIILAVAVLSIVVTAPAGAVGISVLGERILDRPDPS